MAPGLVHADHLPSEVVDAVSKTVAALIGDLVVVSEISGDDRATVVAANERRLTGWAVRPSLTPCSPARCCGTANGWRRRGVAAPTTSDSHRCRRTDAGSPCTWARMSPSATRRTVARETKLPAERLVLEITERVLMPETGRGVDSLMDLRSDGVAVSIDDFGTGYSSLAYLKSFAASSSKIDRSFVAGLPDHVNDVAIVRAISSPSR